MNKFQSTLIAAAASAAAVGFAGVAAAAGTDTLPSEVVRYSADTFASDSGARAFYHQLIKAAESVCMNQPSTTRWASEATLACRRQALEGALAQIKNTRLAAIAAQTKNG